MALLLVQSFGPVGSQTMVRNGRGHPLGVVWTPVGVFFVVTMIDRPTGIWRVGGQGDNNIKHLFCAHCMLDSVLKEVY